MVYTAVKLNLSPAELNAVANGRTVKLYPAHHGKGHTVYVLKSQIDRMRKSHVSGRSIQFKMSPSHVRYNVKHGGGIWDDIWSGINKVSANPIVQNFAQRGIGKLLGGKVCKTARRGGKVQMYNDPVFNTGAYAIKGPRRGGAGKCGAGWFDDVMGVVNKVSENPLVQSLANKGISKLFGGKVGKRKAGSMRPIGGSFRPI